MNARRGEKPKYHLQNNEGTNEIEMDFPCGEEGIMYVCETLQIPNTAFQTVNIVSVDEDRRDQCMAGKTMSLDELNYFERRLHSLTTEEGNTFFAATEALKPKDVRELIDLTCNLHCYSLVDGSQDMNTLGKKLYLHEAIACSPEELEQVNGQKYIAELMRTHEPWETSQGLLYPNKNEPEPVYTTPCFPPYSHGENYVEVLLSAEHEVHGRCTELLTMPLLGNERDKLMERMGVVHENQLTVEDIQIPYIEKCNILNHMDLSDIQTAEDVYQLDDIATFALLSFQEQQEELSLLTEQLFINTPNEISHVICAMLQDHFEYHEGLCTAAEYGYFLVTENPETKVDIDIAACVDYKLYGTGQLISTSYAATTDGLLIYHGDSPEIAGLIKRAGQLALDGEDFEMYGKDLDGKDLDRNDAQIEKVGTEDHDRAVLERDDVGMDEQDMKDNEIESDEQNFDDGGIWEIR